MYSNEQRKKVLSVINKNKWWDILSRFIEVLHINLFIVDAQGLVVLPPEEKKYGGQLLVDHALGFDLFENSTNLLNCFERSGWYYEASNRYHLKSYAIPIKLHDEKEVLAYLIVGPIALNRKLEGDEYRLLARKYEVEEVERVVGELHGIRVVSNMMVISILELLGEIVRDNIELKIKEDELEKIRSHVNDPLSGDLKDLAKEIYSSVYIDEMLVTLLDVALKMTDTECGSIMIFDAERNAFVIKASRGLDAQKIKQAQPRWGEGLAGWAAKENETLVLSSESNSQEDNRIAHLMMRPEIQKSLIMPLVANDQVFGVLNLHTKKSTSRIDENVDNLNYLSQLLSSAL